MRPILFLDIDGVLNTWGPDVEVSNEHMIAGGRIPHAKSFFKFATENFEVRWLTSWFPGGHKLPQQIRALAWLLDAAPDAIAAVPATAWGFKEGKTGGIASVIGDSDRAWLWLDDDLLEEEREWLERTDNLERHIRVCSFTDINALAAVRLRLEQMIRDGTI